MTVRRGMVKIVLGVVVLTLCGIAVFTMSGAKGLASSMDTLPAPGTYNIDPVHTFAYFGARHHIVGLVRGRFDKVTGTISAAKEPADCAVDISIDTASIDTQFAKRDEDLRGPDFFDVKNFPAMTYRGRGIRKTVRWRVDDGWLSHHSQRDKRGAIDVPVQGTVPRHAGRRARARFVSCNCSCEARRFRNDTRQPDGARAKPEGTGRGDRN